MFRSKSHIDLPRGLVPPATLLTMEDLRGVDIQRLVDIKALVPVGNSAKAMGARMSESDLLDEVEGLHEKVVSLELQVDALTKKDAVNTAAITQAIADRDEAGELARGLTNELTEANTRLENALLGVADRDTKLADAAARIDELEKALAAVPKYPHGKK